MSVLSAALKRRSRPLPSSSVTVLRVSSESMERKGNTIQSETYLDLVPYMGDVSLPLHEIRLFQPEHTRASLLNYTATNVRRQFLPANRALANRTLSSKSSKSASRAARVAFSYRMCGAYSATCPGHVYMGCAPHFWPTQAPRFHPALYFVSVDMTHAG